jgi:hypothetical protein
MPKQEDLPLGTLDPLDPDGGLWDLFNVTFPPTTPLSVAEYRQISLDDQARNAARTGTQTHTHTHTHTHNHTHTITNTRTRLAVLEEGFVTGGANGR